MHLSYIWSFFVYFFPCTLLLWDCTLLHYTREKEHDEHIYICNVDDCRHCPSRQWLLHVVPTRVIHYYYYYHPIAGGLTGYCRVNCYGYCCLNQQLWLLYQSTVMVVSIATFQYRERVLFGPPRELSPSDGVTNWAITPSPASKWPEQYSHPVQ